MRYITKDTVIIAFLFVVGFLINKIYIQSQVINEMRDNYSQVIEGYGNVYLPAVKEKLSWWDKWAKNKTKPRTIVRIDTIDTSKTIEKYLYPAIETEPIDFILNIQYRQNKGLIKGYTGQLKFDLVDSNITLLNIKKEYKVFVNPKSNFDLFVSPETGKLDVVETRNNFDLVKSLDLSIWKTGNVDIGAFFGFRYNPYNLLLGGAFKIDNNLAWNYGINIKIER